MRRHLSAHIPRFARGRSLHPRSLALRTLLGRLRTLSHRHRLLRRSVALGLACLAGWSVHAQHATAQATIDALGTTRLVAVVVADLPSGHVLAEADIEYQSWPTGLVPPALAPAADPIGRTVTAPLLAGELVHPSRLAPANVTGLAALLPPGTSGVAIDRVGASVAVQVGDRIDLGTTTVDGIATQLALDLLVVAVDDAQVTVAVPTATSAAVAQAASRSQVTIALRSGG